MIVFADIASLFRVSPMRYCDRMLIQCLWGKEEAIRILLVIMLFELIAIGAVLYTFSICYKCRKFSSATSATTMEFRKMCGIR
jgi:hypothetical protein